MLLLFAASTTLSSAAVNRPLIVGGTDGNPALLPTGQYITPTLAQGSSYQRLATGLRADGNADADSGMSSALSPDGKTLLVLTSVFNTSINYETGPEILFPVLSPLTGQPASFTLPGGKPQTGYNQSEFVFVYDVSSGAAIKRQQVAIPDTYDGIAWDPAGNRFYVSGGIDDRVLVYKNVAAVQQTAVYAPDAPFIILNHNANDTQPIPGYHGATLANSPAAKGPYAALVAAITPAATVAGIALSKDGKTLVAANFHNASVSIVNTVTRKVEGDVVFTGPGSLFPLGEMPFWVAVKSDPVTGAYRKAYVTSQRDNQVIVVSSFGIEGVVNVPSGPTKSVLDANQRYLYVACSNDDSIVQIDTLTNSIVRTISIARPGDVYKGAIPNSIAIGSNGTRLYVTLGGENAVAVVNLLNGQVVGRIPTGWMPTAVAVNPASSYLYVVNEKSNAGPNPGNVYYSWNTPYGASTNTTYRNEYTWELEKSGLLSIPMPDDATIAYLNNVETANNNFQNRHGNAMIAVPAHQDQACHLHRQRKPDLRSSSGRSR